MSQTSHDRIPNARTRLLVGAALALVVLACAVFLVVRVVVPALSGTSDDDRQAAREDVMNVTHQFVRRLGSYGPAMLEDSGKMPEYRNQVTAVITPKFETDFLKSVKTVEQLVAKAGVKRTPEVFATGVSTIDQDSAQVLVAGAFHDSYTQGKGKKSRSLQQEPLPFRFIIDVVRYEGEWRVDDFNPAAPGSTSPQPGALGGSQ